MTARVASRSGRRRAGAPRPRIALLAGLALLSCRRGDQTAPPPPAPPGFTVADVAAAAAVDARLARLTLLAGEYESSLALERGRRLAEDADRLAEPLGEAAEAAGRALDGVRDPRDRALAAPLVAAARRWPALLRAARDEVLGGDAAGARRAAGDLGANDAEVARALEAYRRFRSTWRVTGAPAETRAVRDFLDARRALEDAEARMGSALPAGPRGAEGARPVRGGEAVERLVSSARAAAAGVDGERRPAAERWVEAQARVLRSLVALGAAASPGERARLSLEYQAAKVQALEAAADYARLTAALGVR